MKSRGRPPTYRHPVNQMVFEAAPLGARVADRVTGFMLNLAFSTQAAYAAPLILLAGNRASHRDRLTLEHAAAEGELADAQNERLLNGNTEIL